MSGIYPSRAEDDIESIPLANLFHFFTCFSPPEHMAVTVSLSLRTPVSIVNNILAFCEFYSMENEHVANSGEFISQIQYLMKKLGCVKQDFFLRNSLNSFGSLQVMKTV